MSEEYSVPEEYKKLEGLLLKDPEEFIKFIVKDSQRLGAFKDEINTTPIGFLKGFIMMVLGGRFTLAAAYKDSVVFKIRKKLFNKNPKWRCSIL